MSWSISQVAKMSGTTSRTLRHYDAIGLLPPASVGPNGYRYYERADLLRLQRILLLRELGLSLDSIAEVLDGKQDRVEALKHHQKWLLAELGRMQRLADTIEHTIAELNGGEQMSGEELFDGFEHNPYEAEAVERWGEEAVNASAARLKKLGPTAAKDAQAGWFEALKAVEQARQSGADPADPQVLDAIEVHRTWLENFWTPDRESYIALGRLYVEDERFRTNIDNESPGLAEYLSDAMAAYATARLK